MDIDSSSSGVNAAPQQQQRSIKIHPLAIIGISDHHTRIVSGGSALPPSSPVVGLLFGHYDTTGREVTVIDAEEMEYPSSLGSGGSRNNNDNNDAPHRAAILKKIELYRKVFPQHVVVGWYRVRKHGKNVGGDQEEALPTEEDLRLTQEEMGRYCTTATGEYVNGGPIFVLMDATRTTTVDGGNNGGSSKKPSASSMLSATMEMEEDEELPLTVYETLVSQSTGGNVVFVNVDFDLETYEPERIAVEKVFRTRPTKTTVATSSLKSSGAEGGDESFAMGGGGDGSGSYGRKTGKKSKKDNNNNGGSQKHQVQQQLQQQFTKSSFVRVPTELDEQFESLETSIRAMNLRISVLCEYLTKVERGEAPFDEALLRSVDGLVRQLPLVLASLEGGRLSGTIASSVGSGGGNSGRTPCLELEKEYDNTMLLTYLATVAKTARAVHVYSEKFRTVCDTGKSDRRPLY